MRRAFSWIAATAVLVLGYGVFVPAALPSTAITLDATDLSRQDLALDGANVPASNTSPIPLTLATGPHFINDKTGVRLDFEVTGSGTLDYAASLDSVLSGRGTTTLTIQGTPVQIDATVLSSQELVFNGFDNFLTDSVHTYRMLTGGTALLLSRTGSSIAVSIGASGTVDYDAALDGYLSGRGSSTLTIAGRPLTVDVTDLAGSSIVSMAINGLPGFAAGDLVNLQVLPGTNFTLISNAGIFAFTVGDDGLISGLPATYAGFDVTGDGTSTLTIGNVTITLDATDLSRQDLALDGANVPASNTSPIPLTLATGPHFINDKTGVRLDFEVTGSGTLDYAASLDSVLSGRGTTTLTIQGTPVQIDATVLSSQELVFNGFDNFLTDSVHTYRMLTGGTALLLSRTGSSIAVSIGASGTVDYDAALDGYLSGRGSSTLTIAGRPLTVDVTDLAGSSIVSMAINGLPGFAAGDLVNLQVLPGTNFTLISNAGIFAFTVGDDGLISGLPATYAGFDVTGDGTSTLTIGDPNEPPTADAGLGQSIHAGQTVDLDGGDSFDDVTISANLIYDWSFFSKPAGSTATLIDAGTQTPSFVADKPGTYKVQLVVTDEGGLPSPADQVCISSLNVAPTADAGADQIVPTGQPAVLDGSGTADPDPDGDPLTYAWTLTASVPAGSTATLVVTGPTDLNPTLTPDLEGSYVIRLVVNDGFEDSAPSEVTLMAVSPEAFAEMQVAAACDFVSGLPDASFDAKGHRKSMCNDYAKIAKFIQKGQATQAVSHLSAVIERVDGCAMHGSVDPKGAGQPHAADYLVICVEQEEVYGLLTSALAAIQ